ncbi:WecB/TagA/CpsF family glycosyltransferase [Paraburkholderia acidisoli]|uniref:WecB/TagA/CpsF family glycosyltransferase n=1 Tax=Paraburkholderia acidisoli TaxID=2571748 RepID=A0A7Z2GIG6_9BURK|nr:WecB/TagA/CpsF family glycosyltransferase [Paraburkholderia acidisoli]QGZ62308.1 WecB/TagA/CpsF family glycosyltransferase [Paraburkholderia acidisoli]
MDALSVQESVEIIGKRLREGMFTQHVVVNVAKIVNMQTDARLAESINSCDLINIDGMGVVWAARVLGHVIPQRVAGIDLFENLLGLASSQKYPVYFLGATDDVLKKAVEACEKSFPGLEIVGFHHGYFQQGQEHEIVERVSASGAKMLFVAMSSPIKENFINRWKSQLGVGFVMGVGGTFDVVAGKVNRAPVWMQNLGLEWLFRVYQEPRRMWRRYLVTNSKFAMMLIKARIGRKVKSPI